MSTKTAAIIVAIMLFLAGVLTVGIWLAGRHYQPTIDRLTVALEVCQGSNRQQAASIASQNAGVTALQVLGELRKATAAEAQQKAQAAALEDYGKANEVLAERSDGDVCAAASSAFDDELRRERAK
ncbi:hypothetical protein [Serratia fonticola]